MQTKDNNKDNLPELLHKVHGRISDWKFLQRTS